MNEYTNGQRQKLGSELTREDQARVLGAYVHRFTRTHVPNWARKPRPNGAAYNVQFEDDTDWLAHTRFWVRADGRLDNRADHCESNPTWPDNPEFRPAVNA